MLATLFLAAALTAGPERPLSPEVNFVEATTNDPAVVLSASGQELLFWSDYPEVHPGQYKPRSARGRFLGQARDFEIFPELSYGFSVTSDGDSFYAIALNQDRVPTWRKIGRNGELGPLRNIEGVGSGDGWGMIATSSRLVFTSTDRVVITDHDGKILKDVKPAHGTFGRCVPFGDDLLFITAERQADVFEGKFDFWLTRLTATGETSSELVGTFSGLSGNFGVTAGDGRLLITVFRNNGDGEEVAGFVFTPGARNPQSPELIPLLERRTVRGGNGWATGWDGREFGIAWCDGKEERFPASLTRVGPDGNPIGTDVIATDFVPVSLWRNGGKSTLLGRNKDGIVAMSAPTFEAMARKKGEPKPFPIADVPPIQHSVAFAGKLAVWSEGGDVKTAIRARFLPDGQPFTIARQERLYRSPAAAVATRDGYVIAWSEAERYSQPARFVFQKIGRNGELLRHRELPAGPFDAEKPAIASSGETIALVTSDPTNRPDIRLRLFNSKLDPVATTSQLSGSATAGNVVWNGAQYVVTWLAYPSVDYAFVDEHGVAGKPLSAPDLQWLTLQTTTRSSEVVGAGATLCRQEGKLCLEIASLGGKRLGAVRFAPIRHAGDWFNDIQPILFHDLVVIAQRMGDAYDVLAAPIEPNAEFACVSCAPENEQYPAATTIDGHTYVAYECSDPTLGNVTRLFFREIHR